MRSNRQTTKNESIIENEPKEENKELIIVLGELTSIVKKLDERVAKLERAEHPIEQPKEQPKETVAPVIPVTPSIPETPVPIDYRIIVDSILNKFFGIRIIPRSDAPLFEFTIICPDKYSKMTPTQKEMLKEDIRPKVLSYAESSSGVRQWAETVFNNFSNEIKAQIVSDRLIS